MADGQIGNFWVTLESITSPMIKGFVEAGASGEELSAALAAMTASIEADAAKIGIAADDISVAIAGVGATVTRMGEEETVTAAEVDAANDRILASFAKVGAGADRMAEQHYLAIQGMRAEQAKFTAMSDSMVAQQAASAEKVAAAWAAPTWGQNLVKAKGFLLGVGAAGVVAAYETTKMAANFESSTTRLVTSAGEVDSNLGMVRQGILQLAGEVGDSAEALSAAMYKVESGGQHAGNGLTVLRAAAQGAKAENADLAVVADAVTSALQDYHLPATAAADVTSKLVAATSQGKTTFQELAASMSAILPVASANHVSLNDILGDLASMTVHGMSAQQASQNLADAVRHMAGAFQTQGKEFAAFGLNAQQLSSDLGTKGLSGTIQEIAHAIQSRMGSDSQKVIIDLTTALHGLPPAVQALGAQVLDGTISLKDFTASAKTLDVVSAKQASSFATLVGGFHQIGMTQQSGEQVMQSYSQAMQKMMGTSTGMNVALMLTGENSATTANAIDVVSKATADASGNVKGWSEIQGTFNQKVSQAKSAFGALAITVGDALLPVMTSIAGVLATVATWLAKHQVVAVMLASVIGVILVAALVAATIAMWNFTAAALANPVVLIITAIIVVVALLAAMVYEVVKHWSSISHWFGDLWKDIKKIFSEAVDWVVGVFEGWYPLILGVLSGGILLIPLLIVKYWRQIVGWLKGIWDDVASAAKTVWNAIEDFFGGIWDGVVSVFKTVWHAIASTLSDEWHRIVKAFRPIWEPLVGIVRDIFSIIHSIITIFVGLIEIAAIWLWHRISDAWHATIDPLVAFVKGVWAGMVKIISDAMEKISSWVGQKAAEVSRWFHSWFDPFSNWIAQMWNDLVRIISDAWDNLVGIFVRMGERISRAWHSVWDPFAGFMSFLWGEVSRAVSDGIDNVLSFVSRIAVRVWNAIGDLGSTLVNAGISLIGGFLSGIKSKFDEVKDFVGGIAKWVSDHKGPISYDQTLLVPHGNAVMDGFLSGLQNGAERIKSFLTSFTNSIGGMSAKAAEKLSLPSLSASSSLSVSGFSSGGLSSGVSSTIVHAPVTVVVQGTVTSEQNLQRTIQQSVLQYTNRNASSGWTPAFR